MSVDELEDNVFELTKTPANFEGGIVLQRRQLGNESLDAIIHTVALATGKVASHQLRRDFLNCFFNRFAAFSNQLCIFGEKTAFFFIFLKGD